MEGKHEKYVDAVEKHSELIIKCHDYIWKNPETGYREYKTSAYLEKEFERLGYVLTKPDGIPGFTTELDTGREGPCVLIFGELDSLICRDHPESTPETGAVHCCGHSAQCAALLGLAAALKEPGITDNLSGKIRLCAVPAEELIEMEYRQKLIDEGKISCMGGKPEFLKRGLLDKADIAFMVHTSTTPGFGVRYERGNGCISKKINRALTACALAIGANVDIEDNPGYSPFITDFNLAHTAEQAVREILPHSPVRVIQSFSTACTDMSDISLLMPAIHPYAGGAVGNDHGNDYFIRNVQNACVDSAKWQLALIVKLLENGAARALEIIDAHTPYFKSKEEYFEYMDSFKRAAAALSIKIQKLW